eukprot:m.243836 g.243836  ORF g.243836 m.243836 type:complete len:223 (-) comp48283_c0_seq1:2-670(-)
MCFETDDPVLFKNQIKYIIEHDPQDIDLMFVADNADGSEHDLCANGSTTAVTNDNKYGFLRALAHHRLVARVQKPIDHFRDGFVRVVGNSSVSIFNESDLELALCGLVDFDVDDFIGNVNISHFMEDKESRMKWLKAVLTSLTKEQRARFLQFMTGTASVPAGGCAAFRPRLLIQDGEGIDRLPEAHTCFNQLVLPKFSSFEKCREMITLAITEGYSGFSML